ncbi:hypothetical protein ACFO25_04910 [Paenactinomyces guangxiensis]|uniref:hypothetical protein n=1 Tax=Paenactinomyces guangxiensis TaxID=1490290 RepID=UPI0018DE7638|nr:hypothetical protein [Paenactinomyces guangxiensis]MBH8591006.1 hypothetical protein [Paenactinomyces guangxiensis]
MGKYFPRFVVLILFTFVGIGILGIGEGYADPSFEIPRVDDHFDKVEKGPAPQKTEPVNQNAPEEGGAWDWITEKASGAWEWTKETVSDAWEWTKETASDFWDWFVEVLSKITEVVIDALSAAWDWIVDNYEYIVSGIVLVVGIVLCFFAPPLGASILIGWAVSFGISFAMNGWKIDETTWLDAGIGGLLGLVGMGFAGGIARGLATGLGRKMITGLANAKILGPILKGGGKLISKLPAPIQKIFSKAGFIGSVEGAGTSIVDDLLRGREINWKNALIAGFGGALFVGVGAFVAPKIDPIVDKVTTAFKEYTRPIVAKVSPAVEKLDDFDITKCFSYQKQPRYSAFIDLPSIGNCFRSPDTGRGTGSGNGLLSSNGKFIDPKLESDYEKYLQRKAREGKTPRNRLDWKQARDYWLKDSPMARGNTFNKKAVKEQWYPYHEVHLSNGKRLDSYDPIKGEIVSRKATDLDVIDIATFEQYLGELKNKYRPGIKIRSNKYKRIDGQELKGKQILEIPASNRHFSEIQDYIDLAKNKYGIEIRFREE